jgi:hypothetical protein
MSGNKSFESGIELEEVMIEYRALVQSFIELAGESLPAHLFTLDRGFQRVEEAMTAHQKVLHAAIQPAHLRIV